ncbi:hypothetical protein [Streptomyces sp. NPDC060031]|uniref:hypothetical protein n=1 Tax=Streptomyces sp. NPDC060031 TaxID=3347043 RepID=UPI0036C1D33E
MAVGEPPVVWSLTEADAHAGWRALSWSAGPDGELAVLLVQRHHLSPSEYVKGWPGWGTANPFDAELVIVPARGPERRIPVDGIGLRPTHLALLPRSRFLLASGRAGQDADGTWRDNAVVYSPEGRPEAALCLGDDIAALVSDARGGTWTAYGDEGIFGAHPQSREGLAGWNTAGAATWVPPHRFPEGPVHGLTAATQGPYAWLAWSHPRGTFLTRIDPATGLAAGYRCPLRYVDGLAVRGDRAVLSRREHDEPFTELVRVDLVDGECVITDRQRVPLPGRVVMQCGQGRDGTLWLRAGDAWVRIEV